MKTIYKLLEIIIVFVILLTASCSNQEKLQTNIKNPIILVSGYGSKVAMWENKGFVKYLQQKSLIYGGKLAVDKNNYNIIEPEENIYGKIDFFTLSYSDSTTNIGELSLELKSAINYVKNYTKAKKVMLIGYSMGGVVCRDYLTNNIQQPNVETLVTIASPHKGSFLANFIKGSYGLFNEQVTSAYIDYISDNLGIDINGDALNDLLIEESGNYLSNLNDIPHPININYVSIIGINEMATSVNPYLKRIGFSFYDGDFVCSTESQNMRNISSLQTNNVTSLYTHEIKGVHHFNILSEQDEIFSFISPFIILNK